MAVENSCLHRVLDIKNKEFGINASIKMEAPSVGLALELLFVLRNFEEDDFEEVLFTILKKVDWHSNTALWQIRNFFRKDPITTAEAIHKSLIQGYDLPEEIEKEAKESGDIAEEEPKAWGDIIASFCVIYEVDPNTVRKEYPFPYFLEMLSRMEQVKYQKRIERGLSTAFGMGGIKKEMSEEWFDRAGYNQTSDAVKGKTNPDKTVKDIEELKKKFRSQ